MGEPRTSALPDDIINGASTEGLRLEEAADVIFA